MSLVIKEGGYYVDNNGDKQGPIYRNEHGPYNDTHPWRVKGRSFTTSGQYSKYGHYSPYDLIAEWTEPAAEPEWSEWGTFDALAGRLESQRWLMPDGKVLWRYRKPPAPVALTVYVNCYLRDGPHQSVAAVVDLIDGKPDWSTLRVQP